MKKLLLGLIASLIIMLPGCTQNISEPPEQLTCDYYQTDFKKPDLLVTKKIYPRADFGIVKFANSLDDGISFDLIWVNEYYNYIVVKIDNTEGHMFCGGIAFLSKDQMNGYLYDAEIPEEVAHSQVLSCQEVDSYLEAALKNPIRINTASGLPEKTL